MKAPDTFDPMIGAAEELEPGLRRIVAPNPSPMTYKGTNTYLLGKRDIAVIDPGPAIEEHLEAILKALAPSQRITHIIVTHSHLDHAPLAGPLSAATGAPVLAFGDARAGRSAIMSKLARSGLSGGGEGIDHAFRPDTELSDGDTIESRDWALEVIHTPGHLGNHICLKWADTCFTADHVMGWASSLVSPPDGDLTDFMASCARLQAMDWRLFYPGHGDRIPDPHARLDWLVSHRRQREAAILHALDHGPLTAMAITERVYHDTPKHLIPAACRNVFAHLVDLHQKKIIMAIGGINVNGPFKKTDHASE